MSRSSRPVPQPFQRRLFWVYTVVVLVLTQLIVGTFYLFTSAALKRESRQLLRQTGERIAYTSSTVVKDMQSAALQVVTDHSLQTILQNSNLYYGPYNYFDFHDRNTVSGMLATINSPLLNNARLSVVDHRGNFVTTGYLSTQTTVFTANFQPYYATFLSGAKGTASELRAPHPDRWSDREGQTVFSFLRAIPNLRDTGVVLGLVEVEQPYSMLETVCSSATDKTLRVVLLDGAGHVVYPYGELSDAEAAQLAALPADSAACQHLAEGDYYYTTGTSESSGWRVYILQQADDYLAPVTALRNMLAVFELIFYPFVFIMLYAITSRVTQPIRRLRAMVEQLTPENQELDAAQNFSNNEITLLTQAFNRTLQKLEQARAEALLAERNQAEAHVLAMQAQMNPHFLYNTLMAISALAEESDNVPIVRICTKLSGMLHYVSSYRESTVPLESELAYTRDYLELMKIRYEDFLTYTITAEPGVMALRVPKLVLQPLVENCFSHGFKNRKPPYEVSLSLTAGERGGRPCLITELCDNGEGFSPEALAGFEQTVRRYGGGPDALKNLPDGEIGGLGLESIYLRLLLRSRGALTMEVENRPEGGSRVRICLPIETIAPETQEEEANVPPADRR